MKFSEKDVTWRRFLPSFRVAVVTTATFLVLACMWSKLQPIMVWSSPVTGRFMQTYWDYIIDFTGDDPLFLYSYGIFIITTTTYWVVGLVYITMDVTNRPAALRMYKIQPGTHEPVDRRKLIQAMVTVLVNQIVTSVPVNWLLQYILAWRGMPDVHVLPSVDTWILHALGCVIFEEIGFYYTHRLMHHPRLYKFIHKKHHEWTAPIALVALYSHPVEHFISNILPAYLGVIIFGAHLSVAWAWFFFATVYTLNEHSGYHLPFLPSPEYHDYHHLKFSNNYGVLGVLDALHGTDRNFKRDVAFTRHRVLTSLKSARELFPEKS